MPSMLGRRQTRSPPWDKFGEGERFVWGEMLRADRRRRVAKGKSVRAMGRTKMEGKTHPGG